MTPLPQSKIPNVRQLLSEMISEGNMGQLTTVESRLKALDAAYTQQAKNGMGLEAYVDNVDEPKHIIVFARRESMATGQLTLYIAWIFSTKAERGSEESIAAYHAVIAALADVYNAQAVSGSSWVYQGTLTGADAFYKAAGFELQERVYTKFRKQ